MIKFTSKCSDHTSYELDFVQWKYGQFSLNELEPMKTVLGFVVTCLEVIVIMLFVNSGQFRLMIVLDANWSIVSDVYVLTFASWQLVHNEIRGRNRPPILNAIKLNYSFTMKVVIDVKNHDKSVTSCAKFK